MGVKAAIAKFIKKNCFVDKIERYLKSKNLNSILLYVLIMPPASMHS